MTNGLVWNQQVIQNHRVKTFQGTIQHSLVVREKQMKAELEKHNLGNTLQRPAYNKG